MSRQLRSSCGELVNLPDPGLFRRPSDERAKPIYDKLVQYMGKVIRQVYLSDHFIGRNAESPRTA
jgi:hypothetical protein